MRDDVLDDFLRADRERGLGVYGIHLYREGGPPVERRVRSDDRVNLYSIAKTFTSVAVGLAEAEGRLTLDDRLLDHLPELRPIAARRGRGRHPAPTDDHDQRHEPRVVRRRADRGPGSAPGDRRRAARRGPREPVRLHRLGRLTQSAESSSGSPAPTCAPTSCPACSHRSTCTTRRGTPVQVAIRSPKATSSFAPRSSPALPGCCCKKVSGTAHRFCRRPMSDGMPVERVDTSALDWGERFTLGYGPGRLDRSGRHLPDGRPLRPIRSRLPRDTNHRHGHRTLGGRGSPARCDPRADPRPAQISELW